MRKRSAILCLILLAGCTGALATPAAPTPIQCPLCEQADEFRRLRAVKGHFSGGSWNDDVDRWMGRKHALMVELGDQLGAGTYTRSQVVDLLGEPDAVATAGDSLYDRIHSRPDRAGPSGDARAFLVYHWRGEHDLLYLAVRDEAILGAGWWYAGE